MSEVSPPVLPPVPGSYALWLHIASPAELAIGRLGRIQLEAGHYLYLGSARGPGGLRGRLRHHCRQARAQAGVLRPHWHIDRLWPVARLVGIWYTAWPGPFECAASQALAARADFRVPLAGFGASDCRQGCPAHLLRLPDGMERAALAEALRQALPEGGLSVGAGLLAAPADVCAELSEEKKPNPGRRTKIE